jgi:hypothetical protein
MKRSSAWLVVIVLLSLSCACSRKQSAETHGPNTDQAPEPKTEEPEIKAATPEDMAGSVTVVVPLEVLARHANSRPTNSEADTPGQLLAIDHPVDRRSEEPKHFLHTVFSVNKYAQYAFVAPPHQGNARLRGTFQSFTKRDDPDSTSDKTADVDVMLLNEEEFGEFLHGQPVSATYESDLAHDQMVDWRVPTTYDKPEQYHLVFSNSDAADRIKFVKADFTLSFN